MRGVRIVRFCEWRGGDPERRCAAGAHYRIGYREAAPEMDAAAPVVDVCRKHLATMVDGLAGRGGRTPVIVSRV